MRTYILTAILCARVSGNMAYKLHNMHMKMCVYIHSLSFVHPFCVLCVPSLKTFPCRSHNELFPYFSPCLILFFCVGELMCICIVHVHVCICLNTAMMNYGVDFASNQFTGAGWQVYGVMLAQILQMTLANK